jgi:uncharacterized protein (DUF2164 family)
VAEAVQYRRALRQDFFLKEIGPSVYNRAVADAQERLLARVQELDIDVHESEFGYWKTAGRGGK